ncbi:hypothetical protein M0R45_006983 [Rubus argutus]|uniref:Uncharacterized protein n=1 Tax=Rubus argutus TaxID=59490 RepID=A0AAW1YS35_RUBAR
MLLPKLTAPSCSPKLSPQSTAPHLFCRPQASCRRRAIPIFSSVPVTNAQPSSHLPAQIEGAQPSSPCLFNPTPPPMPRICSLPSHHYHRSIDPNHAGEPSFPSALSRCRNFLTNSATVVPPPMAKQSSPSRIPNSPALLSSTTASLP